MKSVINKYYGMCYRSGRIYIIPGKRTPQPEFSRRKPKMDWRTP